MWHRVFALVWMALAAGCSREPGPFVDANARAHVGMLADTIGSRPVGTPENARARAYIVDQLRQAGLEVRVQETDAQRHELGVTGRVANIIGVLPGERADAVALVAHYDSSPDAPGAADDAFGVAVAIEAARVMAGTAGRRWTLLVLITDGEENGLLGAAALATDRAVMDRLRAYINLEAIGSAGTAVLFQAGPGNPWILAPWADASPHPRGGSYAEEVYRRLPNDTDFTVLKALGIPGLNFAPIGDSYAYHTARDTADRLARWTIRSTGENVVAILRSLQRVDITQRTGGSATFFDIAQTRGVVYGTAAHRLLAVLALMFGAAGCVRVIGHAVRTNGPARWLVAAIWGLAGAGLAVGAMVAATWLLRAAREVYHPWYAHPGRLFVLLILAAATAGWSMARLGQWIPRRAHPDRQPSLAWSLALPAWLVCAAVALWLMPAAAYLWLVPLAAAGLLFTLVPPSSVVGVRLASFVVLAVTGPLWLRETYDLFHFLVPVLGRMALVTPPAAYAAVVAVPGLMLIPPLVGLLAAARPLARPWLVTSLLLLATSAAFGAAWLAPGYTNDRPLRRVVRALQDGRAPGAVWEVASVEPGLDLGPEAPSGWMPASSSIAASVPWGRLPHPFAFRTIGPTLGEPPVAIAGFTTTPAPSGVDLALQVVPQQPGLVVSFILPAGVAPIRSSLPGREQHGRWTATFVAPPAEGIAWEAGFRDVTAELLRETRIAVTARRLPGGDGWQGLPAWLPRETTVWSASATWAVPATAGPQIAPVPPLR